MSKEDFSEQPLIIIVMGKPGSGKGTQAKLLVKKFGLDYFGAGGALRNRQNTKDFTGKKLTEVMNKGKLVPSFVVAELWLNNFEKCKRKKTFKGLVIDGAPRKINETRIFMDAMEWYDWEENLRVILLDISSKESTGRLTKRRQCVKCGRIIPWIGEMKKIKVCDKCGGGLSIRMDDKADSIQRRLDEWRNETMNTVRYFDRVGKLERIDGSQSIDEVYNDILKSLKK